jgi:hypothetical protein
VRSKLRGLLSARAKARVMAKARERVTAMEKELLPKVWRLAEHQPSSRLRLRLFVIVG